MRTFPFLLLLPYIAHQEVLSNLEPFELIYYSMCSKNAKTHVKRLKRKHWLKLNITTKNNLCYIAIMNHADPSVFGITKCIVSAEDIMSKDIYYEEVLNVNGEKVCVDGSHLGTPIIVTFWENKEKGLVLLTEYFSDIFNYPSIHLIIGNELPQDRNIFLNWAAKQKTSEVEDVHICFSGSINDTDISYIFDNIKISGLCTLNAKASDNFRYSFPRNIGSLITENGHWITLNNLFTMNCKFSKIRNAKFWNRDLNSFVKHWLNGGLSALEFIEIENQNLDISEVLNGIDFEEKSSVLQQTPKFKKKMHRFFTSYISRRINGMFDIHRNDKVTATIKHLDVNIFQMTVWPN